MNKNLLLATMLVLSPVSFANLHDLFPPSAKNSGCIKSFYVDPSWQIEGIFTVSIEIRNGIDVYGWQANVIYDPTELVVLDISQGEFLAEKGIVLEAVSGDSSGNSPENVNVGDAVLYYATDVRPNIVLIFGHLWGDVEGVSGDGTVARVTFGVWDHGDESFEMDLGNPILVNKNAEEINNGLLMIAGN